MGDPNPLNSRISKLLVDRDQTDPQAVLARRRRHTVTLVCGADVASSRTLQLAVLTAARIAKRCFPGAVHVVLPATLHAARQSIWPHINESFGQSLSSILGAAALTAAPAGTDGSVIGFGNADIPPRALRATFDGWIACTGPASETPRMNERECCSLAGILCAALAVSEVFMRFAEISLHAGRRRVALSLWRPDLTETDPAALGVAVKYLPREAWLLGLGHLGNAYLWALATLPYPMTHHICFSLNDFDKVEDTNFETGVLFEPTDEGQLKTRVLDRWLNAHGFTTRLVERQFDEHFRRQIAKPPKFPGEPALAFCGFDSNAARRHLATAGFGYVVESGLGGQTSNFDAMTLHTYPNVRDAIDLWPDLDAKALEEEAERQRQAARQNAGYQAVAKDECGRVAFAGSSIAVPFVGVTAACLVVAESLRLLHGGPAYGQIKLRLATPESCAALHMGEYGPELAAGIPFVTLT